jgi:hypothetical protein
MKLEYLANGSPDCPLIRLYDFTPAEAAQLFIALTALASGAAERVDVDWLPFVEPVGGCQLALVRRTWDQAIIRGCGLCEFECGFTPGTWNNVAGLAQAIADGAPEFQWLAGVPGEAGLLISASGHW